MLEYRLSSVDKFCYPSDMLAGLVCRCVLAFAWTATQPGFKPRSGHLSIVNML